jgi:hypothetical protein
MTIEQLERAAAEMCNYGDGDHTGWFRSCQAVRCCVNRVKIKRAEEAIA